MNTTVTSKTTKTKNPARAKTPAKVKPSASAKTPGWICYRYPGDETYYVHTGEMVSTASPFQFADKRVAEAWMEWLNDHKITPGASLPLPLERVYLHAALQAVDPMPLDDTVEMAALAQSVRERGVIEDGKVVPSQTPGEWMLVDGRRRFAACRMAGRETFPAKVVREQDAQEIITATLALRKHFTKGALAFFCLRWLEPVAQASIARKKSKLKRGADSEQESPADYLPRLEDECIRLGFSADIYHQAARVREIFAEDADYKARLEPKIYSGDVGLGAVIAGYAGRSATKGPGKKLAVNYLTLDAKGNATGLLPKAITTLTNGFAVWANLDLQARAALKKQWDALTAIVPTDLA